MKRGGGGHIVNVGSIAGLSGLGSSLVYSASKAAVMNLTRGMAHSQAPEVQVNCVVPGLVETRWTATVSEEFARQNRESTPMGRVATAADVATAIVGLLRSAFITGASHQLDRGDRVAPVEAVAFEVGVDVAVVFVGIGVEGDRNHLVPDLFVQGAHLFLLVGTDRAPHREALQQYRGARELGDRERLAGADIGQLGRQPRDGRLLVVGRPRGRGQLQQQDQGQERSNSGSHITLYLVSV